jgi:predicted ATPase/DNA-binding winged helix-turn-helix (wHTH) protein
VSRSGGPCIALTTGQNLKTTRGTFVPVQQSGLDEKVLSFGPYTLFRSAKVLRVHGQPVRLGSRALDLLIALAERAGEIVSKNELMSYAWPNTVVEENNLRVHVAALRRILGEGQGNPRYIVNVAGRGYSFVAPVSLVDALPAEQGAPTGATYALPSPLTHIVGRDELIDTLVTQMPMRRLLTIVGPGGMGKTTVGIAVAEQLASLYQRVCFVDLSSIDDPALVAAAVATVIGVSTHEDDPVASLIGFLRNRRNLLVLDNCEHVIESVAVLVERVLRAAPGIDIIATSREPLRAEGEHLCNLPPLAAPLESSGLQAKEALSYPAIQLFVERAASGLETFELTDSNVRNVVSICHRLDGTPLAIELVAGRASLLGIDATGQGAGDEVILAAKGRRTAGARHQSLRATLDWSYQLLSPIEQVFLRRLAVFKGLFTAESAAAVVSGGALSGDERLVDLLMSLASKNLLTTDVSGPTIRYRLLHVTRAYASERLTERNERNEIVRRHAEHLRLLLDGANDDWDKMSRDQWIREYGSLMDDARAAMDWAFAPGGNLELGAAITIASLPFGFQLYLIDETIRRAYLALQALAHMSPPKPLLEMRINNALTGLLSSTGEPDDVVLATAERALALANLSGVPRYAVEPLANRAAVHSFSGNFRAALGAAEELESLAKQADDPFALLIADRLGAQVHHLVGNHARARTLIERVLRHPARAIPMSYGQIGVDRQVSMRIILSRLLWLEGSFDQASSLIAETIDRAMSDGPMSICHALGVAGCPIAFWRGDRELAQRYTQSLLEYSQRYNFDRWTALGICYQKSDEMFPDDRATVHLNRDDMSNVIPDVVPFPEILSTINEYWIGALDTTRAERALFGWAAAEVSRATVSKRLTQQRVPKIREAEIEYLKSLEIARHQGALAWELRIAISLAQLWRDQGQTQRALDTLVAMTGRFSEQVETADLRKARALMRELAALQSSDN